MRTLVIGGAASGKSEYVESLAMKCPGPRYYIATMIPCDDESRMRIARHTRIRKKKGFSTIEQYTGISGLRIKSHGTVLLECLGNLVANEMFSPNGLDEACRSEILTGISTIENQCRDIIIVTNDVFADGCKYDDGSLHYLEMLGQLNRELAQRFEHVVEVVCGIPVAVKGGPL